jgi:hypothetical protein
MAITKATASSIAPAAKGDLVAGSATNDAAVLGVGANNTVLTADSSEATGLKWATASGGGKVLQVISAFTSTSTTIATTTFTDTTITATITPTLATSKILVIVSGQVFNDRVQNQCDVGVKLLRGATSLFSQTAFDYSRGNGVTLWERRIPIPLVYMDSPATTSSTTYKIQGNLSTTGDSHSSTWQSDQGSSIVLLEIGA